jgi:hypothetical protein
MPQHILKASVQLQFKGTVKFDRHVHPVGVLRSLGGFSGKALVAFILIAI